MVGMVFKTVPTKYSSWENVLLFLHFNIMQKALPKSIRKWNEMLEFEETHNITDYMENPKYSTENLLGITEVQKDWPMSKSTEFLVECLLSQHKTLDSILSSI
jgi:hypothetical protein